MGEYQSSTILVTENTPLKISKKSWRALIAYWILGLCNNYGYVVMLTAADNIISKDQTEKSEKHGPRDCVYLSTGAILLADIIPALFVKVTAPFLPFFVHVRVAICVVFSVVGLLMVAFGDSITFSIVGVVLTALSSGLGEVTYLQYSSFYDKNVVSTWSSGTGGAGVIGAVSYTIIVAPLGIKNTLLVMVSVPIIMGLTFWLLLPEPSTECAKIAEIQKKVNVEEVSNPKEVFVKKIKLLPGLMKFMIPIGAVYLFEYFINQGTFELIKIKDDFVAVEDQYHWLQVDYQIGVFLSRSSVNLFHIKHIWLMAVLQLVNVVIFTSEAIFYFIPSFWIVLAFTLFEGLLGGAAYVNTFYRISSEVPEEDKQFSMAVTTFADSIGITLAGMLAMLAHNHICDLPLP